MNRGIGQSSAERVAMHNVTKLTVGFCRCLVMLEARLVPSSDFRRIGYLRMPKIMPPNVGMPQNPNCETRRPREDIVPRLTTSSFALTASPVQ